MNCTENYYDLIGEIIARPENSIQFSRPFWNEKKFLEESDVNLPESERILLIPLPDTAQMKESFERTVAGDSYKVTVTFDIGSLTPSLYDQLERLKKNVNHLILKSFPDNYLFVRAADPAYSFTYTEGDGVMHCQFDIQNLSGAQRIFSGMGTLIV